MLVPPLRSDSIVEDWYERHTHRVSLVLHVIGIPLMVLGIVLVPVYVAMLSPAVFLVALAAFVGGYAFQFIGHLVDWTEPGELRLLRLWIQRKLAGARGRVAVAEPVTGGDSGR